MAALTLAARGASRLCIRAFLCLGAALGAPFAAHAAESGSPPAQINPTGRTLEMIVPLHYRDFYLGDLPVRLTPQQEVEAPLDDACRILSELLRPEALQALRMTGSGERITLSDLRGKGFNFRFDPGSVSIVFTPTLDQKAEGNISIQARNASHESPNAADPAKLAAFLNMRMAADHISVSPAGREGLTAPRLDMEAAVRWKGVVVEAEATYEPDDASVFGMSGEGFKRRGTRIIRDFETEALRLSAGDIYPAGTAFQNTPDLLGVSLERSYAKLQPGRNIRPTSRRSFRIERPSSIDIQVNGVTERRLRLDPGDYNLSDLPVRSGLNEITLLIEDDAGGRERLEFTVFRDGDLLEPGLSEWAIAAGLPAGYEAGEPDYGSGEYFATGYYRTGLSESLTAEAHLQAGARYGLGGLSLLYGSAAGLIALDGAASLVDGESWGAAIEAYYSPPVLTDAAGRDHALRFALKGQTEDFTASLPNLRPADGPGGRAHERWLDLSASYSTMLPMQVSAFVSGGYGFGFSASDDRVYGDFGVNRSFGRDLSMGLSAGYSAAYYGKDYGDLSLLFRLNYRPGPDTSLGFAYDPAGHRAGVSYDQRAGKWRIGGELAHETSGAGAFDPATSAYAVDGSIHYTGSRANLALHQQSRLAGLDAASLDQRTSLRIETALAYADGAFAFGRPVNGGFAIVRPHQGLDGHEVTIGRENSGGAARADEWGAALIPSVTPYALNRIEYAVAGLPPGYDLGDGLFDLHPQYRSGYVLTVGSAYAVTAIGTLADIKGEPLALVTGVAVEKANPEKKVELFTNREGRFAAQGLAPGRWIVEMAGHPHLRFSLDIPAGSAGLVRAGELPIIGEE